MTDGRRWSRSLKKAGVTVTLAVCAMFGVQLATGGFAFANAANPDPDTVGTFTVNSDGTVTADLSGTWTFVNQDCAGRYGQGFAVDWWGISSSPTPNPNFTLTNATTVTAPGTITRGSVTATGSIPIAHTGMYFHVGDHYAGESVNSASTCTDVGKNSVGSWSAEATYPSQADIPPAVCVNMYDDHGKEGQPSKSPNDYSPTGDHDNSIQTNDFDPTMGNGYCVALQPSGQTIQGEIYACVNGAPTSTLVSGGTIAVASQSLSSANPLAPTQVPAGTYTMTATAPAGQEFVACGQSGVTIGSPTSASQSVTVPAGGAGDGRFYTQAAPPPGNGYLEVCKSSANSVSGEFRFYISALHRVITVPAGACSHPIKVPAGVVLVEEELSNAYQFASVSANPASRVVNIDPTRHNISVQVVQGGVGQEVVVTFVNQHATGQLKICQVAGSGVARGTEIGFTTSATQGVTYVPAGAGSGGLCEIVGTFWRASNVTITQQIPAGDSVSDIGVRPTPRQVGTANLAAGKVTVRIGSGTTVVRYTDTRP